MPQVAIAPLTPLITTGLTVGLGVAQAAGAFGRPDAPKIEIPKPEPAPVLSQSQQAPPPAGPRQDLAELENEADRQAAANIQAAYRKKGRRASILTSTPLGSDPQPQPRVGRSFLGS